LPVPTGIQTVTLGEGGTPLLRSRKWPDTYFKAEFMNPTGSHKDRPLSLAIGRAVSLGAKLITVFSAGSTGLSAAAYAARAGIPCAVLMSRGAPEGRLSPLASYGAQLVEVDADIDSGIRALTALAGRNGIYVASTTKSANAVQAEAGRTIAFEIVEALGETPARVLVPTGGGGTIAAIYEGFVQLQAMGFASHMPRLIAVVPDRYDTLRTALRDGVSEDDFFSLPSPEEGPTVLNKIAHAHAPDGVGALGALRGSSGSVLAFSDEAALDAVPLVGREEGFYLEPSSAIVRCALEHLDANGGLDDGPTVALACGAGFRETHVMLDRGAVPRRSVRLDDLEATLAAMGANSWG
jgi:threonine synthase